MEISKKQRIIIDIISRYVKLRSVTLRNVKKW